MSFTSYSFLLFFLVVLALYWLVKRPSWQNILLLAASYLFYAWVHPWYALLLGAGTLADYGLALALPRSSRKKLLLALSLVLDLGVLCFFKYYDFFIGDAARFLGGMGVHSSLFLVKILLPVGLSFYTLKRVAYMLDVSKGVLEPERDPVAFALFAAFFPQVTAGPIDRAQKLLPQIHAPRPWKWENFFSAWPLLVMGMFKKVVIANSLAPVIERIFHLNQPTGLLALAGALGFTLQILADFSAYTDLSRGIAFLLGFETTENFKSPYLSLTPTDFWNRWHITLSFWLRDYIFFPLRRALLRHKDRLPEWLIQAAPPLVTMLISGAWHGVGWTFLAWGGMYGVLIAVYQALGLGGAWKPSHWWTRGLAWLVMFAFIVFGWMMFAAPSLGWVAGVFSAPFLGGRDTQAIALLTLSVVAFYASPMIIKLLIDRYAARWPILQAVFLAAATVIMLVYLNSTSPDFIYFKF